VPSPLYVDLTRARDVLELDRHVRLVPPSATVRGVFFNLARDALIRADLGHAMTMAPELFRRRRAFESYPVRELLDLYARTGALLHEDPVEGVAIIARRGSRTFAKSWLGDRFRKAIVPDPSVALRWIEGSRDYLCNYGFWRVERRNARYLILHMFNEYTSIEPWQRGGCEGLLRACGVDGVVRSELDDRFSGRLHVEWD